MRYTQILHRCFRYDLGFYTITYFLLLIAGCVTAHGLTPPTLVQDLNGCSAAVNSGGVGTAIRGKYVLRVTFPEFGPELGVVEGNKLSLLKDITPGTASTYVLPFSRWVMKDLLIFAVDPRQRDPSNQRAQLQIWRSDGTTDGTYSILNTIDKPDSTYLVLPQLAVAMYDQDVS